MLRRTAVKMLGTLALLGPRAGTSLLAQEKKEAPPSPPEPNIKVGDTFPDFTLLDQNRNKVSLHDFKGKKNVVVAFVVFAFTGG
jgi:cytochrome oxidase Cu insertion factor (SCO1/SenC/PrrC family)